MPAGTGLDALEKKIPERFHDVGIAEEHAVLMAAGMAAQGLKPVCAIYSTFLQRAYDPIIHDVCLQNLPVTFCLDRAGLSPNDGPTHHGVFDLSFLRCVPNALVMQPKDEDELQDMLLTGISSGQPAFIRYPRGNGLGVALKKSPETIEIGKAEVITEGETCSIWALGPYVESAKKIAEKLSAKYNFECSLVNVRFVKPLDLELLIKHASSHDFIVTMEDNALMGGLGSAIMESLQANDLQVPVKCFGWPDTFISHGSSVQELRTKYDLDDQSIVTSIESFLNNRQKKSNRAIA